jgi:ATP-dependent DNA ligase
MMDPNIHAWIKVDSRVENGKIKKSSPTIVTKGKNLGKMSATNVLCQALRDAYGLHNKQLKKAVTEIPVGVERHPPMLAQLLKEQKTPPDFSSGVYVQRKYNGVRTVTTYDQENNNVIMYSRRKLIYPGFGYIKNELKDILEHYWAGGDQLYLDGEIYRHDLPLQDISGYSRREDQPGDVKVNYMIYDCFVANKPHMKYSERKELLDEIFADGEFVYCKEVETFLVHSREEIDKLYDQFIEENMEGAMVRVDTYYHYSQNERHSKVLLKLKETFDTEMEIVGFMTGKKGKASEALMMVCRTPEGKVFNVTPAMELPARITLAKKMSEVEDNGKTYFENHYLGKPVIIYYDEMSKDKVPQRARTKLEVRTWD